MPDRVQEQRRAGCKGEYCRSHRAEGDELRGEGEERAEGEQKQGWEYKEMRCYSQGREVMPLNPSR
jgi:hypothetical protein